MSEAAARALLSPYEVAIGTAFGPDDAVPPLRRGEAGASPREALEAEVLAALQRGPCGVSFSGGRDSSLVLAVATHVARREGLPLPVPLTHVFPDVPESREDRWQEMAVRALGLQEWVRLPWHRELDVLGEISTGVLRRVGVLDPFNAFFHDPLCARVAGGSLLTGIGGDEALGGVQRAVAFRIRHKGKKPRPADLWPLALSYAPVGVRARSLQRTHPFARFGWIRPKAARVLERRYCRWQAADPLPWDDSVRRFWASRECQVGLDGLRRLAAAHAVEMCHPLSSPAFLTAMIAAHGRAGPGGRSRATEELSAGLLPEELTHRPDKAAFGGAFWTGPHDFAQSWSGGGVDLDVVDPERLRDEWRNPDGPHVASLLLLQQAWLHDVRHATGV